MDVYVGLDISLRSTHLCVVDQDGKVLAEGAAPSDPQEVDAWLRRQAAEWKVRRIVWETGQLSTHFFHALRDFWPVVCIDARHAHAALKAQRVKTDMHDARGLAQIARTGWYRAVHVKSDTGQSLRSLMAARKQLVELRLSLENHIRGTLKTFGVKLGVVSAGTFAPLVRAAVAGRDPHLQEAMRALLEVRDGLRAQFAALQRRCAEIAKRDQVCQRLMTVPGVGVVVALTYRAEIDDPRRFRKSRDVGVHLGLTPKRFASGEVDRSGRISKCGNGGLRTLLFEAAATLLTRSRKWSRLKAWGVRLMSRLGFKAAATATARKLAVILHRMWIDETEFSYGEPPPVATG